jgi:hypothetical protein
MSGIQPSRPTQETTESAPASDSSHKAEDGFTTSSIEQDLHNLNVMEAGRLMVHMAHDGYSGPARQWWVPSLQHVLGSVELDEDAREQLGEYNLENDMVPRDAAGLVIAAYDQYLESVSSVVEA